MATPFDDILHSVASFDVAIDEFLVPGHFPPVDVKSFHELFKDAAAKFKALDLFKKWFIEFENSLLILIQEHAEDPRLDRSRAFLLCKALETLNLKFLEVFGIPIQYLDGRENMALVTKSLMAAAARGDWRYVFALANCPKGLETLMDPLAKNSPSLSSFCKSVRNFFIGIGTGTLDGVGFAQLLSGGNGSLAPLHALNLSLFGADRTPHCHITCVKDAKECKLRIDNDNVATVADCLVTIMVSAMTFAGYSITMLSLGNEAIRCVVGPQNFRHYKGKYDAYPSSAAAGLLKCFNDMFCSRRVEALVAEVSILPHMLIWRDMLHNNSDLLSNGNFINALSPPLAAAVGKSVEQIKAVLAVNMPAALDKMVYGFATYSSLSKEDKHKFSSAGGVAAMKSLTMKRGADPTDYEECIMTMILLSHLGVEKRSELNKHRDVPFEALGGKKAKQNRDEVANKALESFTQFELTCPVLKHALYLYLDSAVKDIQGSDLKLLAAKLLLADVAPKIRDFLFVLDSAGVVTAEVSKIIAEDPRFGNIGYWGGKDQFAYRGHRALLLLLEILGIKNWAAHHFLLTKWTVKDSEWTPVGNSVKLSSIEKTWRAYKSCADAKGWNLKWIFKNGGRSLSYTRPANPGILKNFETDEERGRLCDLILLYGGDTNLNKKGRVFSSSDGAGGSADEVTDLTGDD